MTSVKEFKNTGSLKTNEIVNLFTSYYDANHAIMNTKHTIHAFMLWCMENNFENHAFIRFVSKVDAIDALEQLYSDEDGSFLFSLFENKEKKQFISFANIH